MGVYRQRGEKYACQNHKRVDCSFCFNWPSLVVDDAKEKLKYDFTWMDDTRNQKWLAKRKKYFDRVEGND